MNWSLSGWARSLLLAVALPTILLLVWFVASDGSESFFFPSLRTIVDAFPATWFEGRIAADLLPSVLRLGVGFGLSLVLGIALGVAIGSSRTLRQASEPVLEFFRALPPPVLVPVLLLLLGTGDRTQVAVIATGAIWPVLLNTVEGVRGVDEVLTDTARVYRLGRRARLRALVLRSASPQIMAGARQALSIAIILMVISELIASVNGVGFSVVQFQRTFAIPEMWTGILVLSLLGFVLSLLFRFVERRVLSWYYGQQQARRGA